MHWELPPDFTWEDRPGVDSRWLRCGNEVVAVVSQRIDDRWVSTVNRHLEPARWKGETRKGPAGLERAVEQWAIANADRLRAETALAPQSGAKWIK